MAQWDRRRFISTAAIAAGSGIAGWHGFGFRALLAQAPARRAFLTKSSTPSRSAARRPYRFSESCPDKSGCTCCLPMPASFTASAARS